MSSDERHELDRLEARLREADGRRVWLQQRARADLTERGEPVTRLNVARHACRLLDEVELSLLGQRLRGRVSMSGNALGLVLDRADELHLRQTATGEAKQRPAHVVPAIDELMPRCSTAGRTTRRRRHSPRLRLGRARSTSGPGTQLPEGARPTLPTGTPA